MIDQRKKQKMKNKPTAIKVTRNRILPGVTVCSSPPPKVTTNRNAGQKIADDAETP
jgi:hypothetical protein